MGNLPVLLPLPDKIKTPKCQLSAQIIKTTRAGFTLLQTKAVLLFTETIKNITEGEKEESGFLCQ